jgi:hypothetical protein
MKEWVIGPYDEVGRLHNVNFPSALSGVCQHTVAKKKRRKWRKDARDLLLTDSCLFSLPKVLLIRECYRTADATDIPVNRVQEHCRRLEREARNSWQSFVSSWCRGVEKCYLSVASVWCKVLYYFCARLNASVFTWPLVGVSREKYSVVNPLTKAAKHPRRRVYC